MRFYDLQVRIPFHWRFLEGISTGSMTLVHFYSGKYDIVSLVVFLVHWFFSFQFHMTYTQEDKEKDQLWIQFVSCERLGFCHPKTSLITKAVTFPLVFSDLSVKSKTLLISSFCLVWNTFYLFFYCNKKGLLFFSWMLFSFFLFLISDTVWYNQFSPKHRRFDQTLRSPFICVLFHFVLGVAQLYDGPNECCQKNTKPVFPRYWDLLYYLGCHLIFVGRETRHKKETAPARVFLCNRQSVQKKI